MIDIRLDRHGLPHFLLGRPVLGIEGFFSRCKFAAFFFSASIFGSFSPSSSSLSAAFAAR